MSFYVPSHGRADLVEKTLPSWPDGAYLVIEEEDVPDYAHLDVEILVLPPHPDTGIGFVRQFILEHASDDFILMCDDDHIVEPNIEDVLFGYLQDHPTCPQVAAWKRVYWRFAPKAGPPAPSWGGMGFEVYAIQTRLHRAVGYDTEIAVGEDLAALIDLALLGYAPQVVHTETEARPINQRFGAGGCAARREGAGLTLRQDNERTAHAYVERHGVDPAHINVKDDGYLSLKWAKFYDSLGYQEQRRSQV